MLHSQPNTSQNPPFQLQLWPTMYGQPRGSEFKLRGGDGGEYMDTTSEGNMECDSFSTQAQTFPFSEHLLEEKKRKTNELEADRSYSNTPLWSATERPSKRPCFTGGNTDSSSNFTNSSPEPIELAMMSDDDDLTDKTHTAVAPAGAQHMQPWFNSKPPQQMSPPSVSSLVLSDQPPPRPSNRSVSSSFSPKVTIKTLRGTEMVIALCRPSIHVDELNGLIEEATSVPRSHIRLMHRHRQRLVVEDEEVQAGSSLVMIQQFGGAHPYLQTYRSH